MVNTETNKGDDKGRVTRCGGGGGGWGALEKAVKFRFYCAAPWMRTPLLIAAKKKRVSVSMSCRRNIAGKRRNEEEGGEGGGVTAVKREEKGRRRRRGRQRRLNYTLHNELRSPRRTRGL